MSSLRLTFSAAPLEAFAIDVAIRIAKPQMQSLIQQ